MKLTILGSGGFRRTPRPGCRCAVCSEMRQSGKERRGCSLFLHDANILFDTPEEIAAELESAGLDRVDHIFYTHWHPDHTLGARILEIMNTRWSEKPEWRMAPSRTTEVHMPGPVHGEIMSRFGPFFEFWQHLGIARVNRMDGPVKIDVVNIEAIVFETRHRTTTHSTVYVVTSGEKKFLYAPCDITPFPKDERFRNCDLMILQVGWQGPEMAARAKNGPHYEISMEEILDIAGMYRPKRLVLTHIGDEVGMLPADMESLEAKLSEFNLAFAYDGMEIVI